MTAYNAIDYDAIIGDITLALWSANLAVQITCDGWSFTHYPTFVASSTRTKELTPVYLQSPSPQYTLVRKADCLFFDITRPDGQAEIPLLDQFPWCLEKIRSLGPERAIIIRIFRMQ
jgi:hypothetical protein